MKYYEHFDDHESEDDYYDEIDNYYDDYYDDYDEMDEQARELVIESRQASLSWIQRRLRVGYNRAARMIERMEREGLVAPAGAAGTPREVLVQAQQAEVE